MATTFDVTGPVGTPLTGLDFTTLASDFTPTTVSINNAGTAVGYAGVSLCTLLTTANFQYPTTGVKNGFLSDYVAVTGTGDQTVVVSEGEIDPSFGGINSAMTDIVAYQQNGTTITPTLIIPGDVNGGIGGRDIVDISGIAIGTAIVPTPPPVTNPPPTVTLNGDGRSALHVIRRFPIKSACFRAREMPLDGKMQGRDPQLLSATGAAISHQVSSAYPSGRCSSCSGTTTSTGTASCRPGITVCSMPNAGFIQGGRPHPAGVELAMTAGRYRNPSTSRANSFVVTCRQ